MEIRQNAGVILTSIVRKLPHLKLDLPYPRQPSVRISFYLDTELGLWLGYNEPAVVNWWKGRDLTGKVVFDIGAYTGIYSLLAASNGAQDVHAFEPDPTSAERIRTHSRTNNVPNITVNETVVSNVVGKKDLVLNPEHRQHSLVAERRSDAQTRVVESTTIDSYPSDPDVLKVDVEGAAAQVIEGAEDTIKKHDSQWIIEVHNEDERDAIARNFEGYHSEWIDNRHIVLNPATS